MLRSIKRHWPESRIHWWLASSLAPLLEGDPDLTGILRFERQGWSSPKTWLKAWHTLRWTRAQRFDWVIDLQGLARSGFFAWAVNGGCTVGINEPREGARALYDYVYSRPFTEQHAVDWYLGVLQFMKVPAVTDFPWLPKRPEIAAQIRKKWPVDSSRWIAIQPGARWLNKRWPAESFAEVVRRLSAARPDVRFAVLGGREEQQLAQTVVRGAPERCLDLSGQLSLQELVEWIRSTELMITNDTGPLHLASALGIPVVSLYGPTDPQLTGPYGQPDSVLRHPLPCSPCEKPSCANRRQLECLTSITPELVLARALTALAR